MSVPSLLPWWVASFPLLCALASFGYTYAVTAAVLRLGRPAAAELSGAWYQRARVLSPALTAAREAQLVPPLLLALVAALLAGPASGVPTWLCALCAFPLTLLGAALATRS